jgi:hypothetical protein
MAKLNSSRIYGNLIVDSTINGVGLTSATNAFTLTSGSATLVRSGAHALTLTTIGATDVTFPTSGTLATTAGLDTKLNLSGGTVTGTVDFTGGSGSVPAIRIKSAGNSWSEGLGIHPAADNGFALAVFRPSATLTNITSAWGIGNLGNNATNNFGLIRNGLTGGVGLRADSVFDVTQAGVFRFGFNPTVGSNTIWHAGNLTNLNQLTNGPGYLITESDTLATVTGRGATTATAISITNTTASTSTLTGALIVSGGVGVGGTVTASTFNATSLTDGGFQGIAEDSATQPSHTWTGDLDTGMYRVGADQLGFTAGGTGRLTVSASQAYVIPTTASTSTSTGALRVGGGVGIGGALHIGTTLTVGTTSSLGGDATFTNAANRTISIANTAAGTIGRDLSILSGSTVAGGTNIAGGNVNIRSGLSTGTGTSSIIFQTPTPGASGTALNNNLTTRMTINSSGISIPGDLTVSGTVTINNVDVINTSSGIIFDGATANANKTTLNVVDPTAVRSILLPDASGTVSLDGHTHTITANATDGLFDITGTNGSNAVTYAVAPYAARLATPALSFYLGTTNPEITTRLNLDAALYATQLYDGGSRVAILDSSGIQKPDQIPSWLIRGAKFLGAIDPAVDSTLSGIVSNFGSNFPYTSGDPGFMRGRYVVITANGTITQGAAVTGTATWTGVFGTANYDGVTPTGTGTSRQVTVQAGDWLIVTNASTTAPSSVEVVFDVITGANTITSFGYQTANTFLASQDQLDGSPSFRTIISNDIPNLDTSKITSGTFADARIPNLNASKITAGTLAVARGGTGQTTLALARNAMGLGNTTGAVPIANGGTGATTAAAARDALGLGNTTGALPVANGGTGATTFTAGVLLGNGTSAITSRTLTDNASSPSSLSTSSTNILTEQTIAKGLVNVNGSAQSAITTIWASTAAGTAGQALKSNGAGVAPSFGQIAYSEISGTPTIPTVNDATLTIAASTGISLSATPTFTANASVNKTITIENSAPNATHTGDVTGSGALTLAATIGGEKTFTNGVRTGSGDQSWQIESVAGSSLLFRSGTTPTTRMTLSVAGAISTATWNGGTIGTLYGGTGLTTFGAAGRILYSTTASALATLAAGTANAGQFLQSNGTGAPSWVVPAGTWRLVKSTTSTTIAHTTTSSSTTITLTTAIAEGDILAIEVSASSSTIQRQIIFFVANNSTASGTAGLQFMDTNPGTAGQRRLFSMDLRYATTTTLTARYCQYSQQSSGGTFGNLTWTGTINAFIHRIWKVN